MVETRLELPDEVAVLQEMVRSQTRHYEEQRSKSEGMVSARDKTIALLEEKIHLLLSARFGASSEQVSEAQIGLFNEAEANAEPKSEAHAEIEVPGHRRAKPKRKPLPEHLPRVVVVHDLDEEDKFCPHDGAALKLMSEGMFECSEQFDIVLPRAHQNRPDDGSAHP